VNTYNINILYITIGHFVALFTFTTVFLAFAVIAFFALIAFSCILFLIAIHIAPAATAAAANAPIIHFFMCNDRENKGLSF
jgi:hypothetical protein